MKKYVINTQNLSSKKHFIATQAVSDINTIATGMGYVQFNRYVSNIRGISTFLDLYFLLRLIMIGKENLILFQHPLKANGFIESQVVKILSRKKTNLIVIIHDLETYRTKKDVPNEIDLLKIANAVICHNEEMRKYLISKGVAEDKIVILEIFDYLVSEGNKRINDVHNINRSLVVAGNLNKEKCGYLYRMIKDSRISIDIYGVNFDTKELKKSNTKYHGAFPADELPNYIEGGFGLVWDGNSLNTCSGQYGEYLMINNPHKTSLYIVSGLPIVIWKYAAMAQFISEKKCGIVVETISEAIDYIQAMKDDEYLEMKQNVLQEGLKLKKGYYTKRAIEKAEVILRG